MTLELNSVHGHHSLGVQLAVFFILVYGLWCLITIILRRSRRPGFLALLPLFVTVPVAWLSYLNVLEGMSRTGSGGRAALNAGLAEAILSLGIGALATTGLAIVALVRGPRQGSSLAASAVAAALVAALAGVTLWYGTYAYRMLTTRLEYPPHPLAGAIGTAVAIVAYLVFAWRRQFYPSPLAVATAAALATLVVRQQVVIYQRIAISG